MVGGHPVSDTCPAPGLMIWSPVLVDDDAATPVLTKPLAEYLQVAERHPPSAHIPKRDMKEKRSSQCELC
jgi:hypothetical protein